MFTLERVGGIEPPATGWKPVVLPLYDTRVEQTRIWAMTRL